MLYSFQSGLSRFPLIVSSGLQNIISAIEKGASTDPPCSNISSSSTILEFDAIDIPFKYPFRLYLSICTSYVINH